MRRTQIHSAISYSTPDTIYVKGHDFCRDLLGKLDLGDMAFLELSDRLPTPRESAVFNAIAITLVEHGLTPSALAARLTIAGAPEALQAAVAAGISGLGSVFVGSAENAARVLQEAMPFGAGGEPEGLARTIVSDHLARKATVPGIGHHFHKPVDPRTSRLFEIAAENGLAGGYVALMNAIAKEAQTRTRKQLPVNATGAIAAIASELRISWNVVRGITVMARAIGLVGHIREELANPIAHEIKKRAEEESTEITKARQRAADSG